ncbi:MAG: ABC transporter ATP-binding protein [Bacteroidota bacterium]
MRTGKQIIREFARRNAPRIGLAFVTGFLARIVALTIPLVIGRYFALQFGYASLRTDLLSDLLDSWLLLPGRFLQVTIGLVALWGLLRYLERFHTLMLGEFLVQKLREELFRKQLRTTPEAFARRSAGKYLLRYSGDLKQIQNLFNLGIMGLARDLLLLIPAALTFAMLLPQLALPVGLGFGLVLLPIFLLNRQLYRTSVHRRDRKSGLLAFVTERLHRHEVIQAFNREAPENQRFRKRSRRVTQASQHYFRYEALIRTLIPGLVYLIPGLVFLSVGIGDGTAAREDPESVSLAFLLMIAIAPVLRRLAGVTVHWELGKLSMRKLLVVLNLPDAEPVPQPDLVPGDGHLQIAGLSVGSPDRGPLIHCWSAELPAPGLTWIQSPNGTGKTRLLRVLLRLEAPLEGQILLDGQPLEAFSPHSVRRQMAVASEAWPLLGRTVFEAISYSRKPQKRPRAGKALDKLQAALPPHLRLELDDEIGELGRKLSAGQRRLLLIARALLTRKPILLLDEPLHNLDLACRQAVIRRLERFRTRRNIIVLSHAAPPEGLPPDQHLKLPQVSFASRRIDTTPPENGTDFPYPKHG